MMLNRFFKISLIILSFYSTMYAVAFMPPSCANKVSSQVVHQFKTMSPERFFLVNAAVLAILVTYYYKNEVKRIGITNFLKEALRNPYNYKKFIGILGFVGLMYVCYLGLRYQTPLLLLTLEEARDYCNKELSFRVPSRKLEEVSISELCKKVVSCYFGQWKQEFDN